MRAINGFGCIDIDSVLVTVNQLPKIVLRQQNMTVCRNAEVQLAVDLETSEVNGMYFYQLWLEKGNRLYKGWIHVWR